MRIDKHIYLTKEEYQRILEYSKVNNLSFSKAVCNLSINALNGIDTLDRLSKQDEILKHILYKQNLNYSLVEQIYSDLNFDYDNITNPKDSIALKEFNKKIRNNKFDD